MSDDIKIKVTDVDSEPIEELEVEDINLNGVTSNLGNLVKQVVRFQVGLITLPLNLLPTKSRYHAKNSVREGYLSIKTLIDEVTTGIERGLDSSLTRDRVRIETDDDILTPADRI